MVAKILDLKDGKKEWAKKPLFKKRREIEQTRTETLL